MKKLALAAALVMVGSAAFAGTLAPPVMEPEVIVAQTGSSTGAIVVGLMALVLLAALR